MTTIIKPPKITEETFAIFVCMRCGCRYAKPKDDPFMDADSWFNSEHQRVYRAVCPACGETNLYVDTNDVATKQNH